MKNFAITIAFLSITFAAASAQASLTAKDIVQARPASTPANVQSAGAWETIKCTGSKVQKVAQATAGDYGMLGAPAFHIWLLMIGGPYTGISAGMCFEAN